MEFKSAYESVALKFSLPRELKHHQEILMRALVEKKHAMGILPTGFGKSLVYCAIPYILDLMEPDKCPHISLVISPLKSLVADQVTKLKDCGASAEAILPSADMDVAVIQGIIDGLYAIVFACPEVLKSERWRERLKNERFRAMVSVVAIDEAHCVIQWGTSFRPDYMVACDIVQVLHKSPCLLLTATCTQKMKEGLMEKFCLGKLVVAAAVPNRPNIFLRYTSRRAMQPTTELSFYIKELRDFGNRARKCIVYSTMASVGRLYEMVLDVLDNALYSDGRRVLDIYVSRTPASDKARILENFRRPNSTIRCLFATDAFGMGVDIPDVELVVHWGASSSVLSYWQEVGRAGRDGRNAEAIMFATPVSVMSRRMTDDCIRALQKEVIVKGQCVRVAVLSVLYLECMPQEDIDAVKERIQCSKSCASCVCSMCMCCNVCRSQCNCRNIASNNNAEA